MRRSICCGARRWRRSTRCTDRSRPGVRRLAPELEDGHRQEQARRLRDDLSALYVALTRARQALHLWVEPANAAAGEREDARESLSFAAILRATLKGTIEAPFDAAAETEGGMPLYRAGDRERVASSIAAARLAQRVERQGELPLSSRPPRARLRAVRPAVSLDDLPPAGVVRAASIIAAALPDSGGSNEDWSEIEASLAAPRRHRDVRCASRCRSARVAARGRPQPRARGSPAAFRRIGGGEGGIR